MVRQGPPARGRGAVTWRLAVPRAWSAGLDPEWLPRRGADGWRRVFQQEDTAGRVFLDRIALEMPWKDLARAAADLSLCTYFYRVQLRVSEAAAGSCGRADEHLVALAEAVPDQVPTRTEPPGAWRVRALAGGTLATLAEHDSADGAEGDAAARRSGDAGLACWAEPAHAPPPNEVEIDDRPPLDLGWQPSHLPSRRIRVFAVEDAARSLLVAAADRHLGPDVVTSQMLATLGAAAWVMVRQYRAELAAIWTQLESCPSADDHEAAADVAMGQLQGRPDGPGPGRWRHVELADLEGRGLTAIELSDHDGLATAAASVAAARASDHEHVRWSEPVRAGSRPFLVTT